MNREQNIDDILKLLKDSVQEEHTTDSSAHTATTAENISTESLQQKLKDQYIDATASIETDSAESEYIIDSDFLTSAMTKAPEHTSVAVVEKKMDEDLAEETVEETLEDIEEFIDEPEQTSVDEPEDTEMPPIYEKVIEPQECADDEDELNAVDEPEIIMQPLFMPQYARTADDEISDASDSSESESVAAEEDIEEASIEEVIEEEPLAEAFEEEQELSSSEPHETFLASMRKIGVDFTTEEIYSSSQKSEEVPFMEDALREEITEDELDTEEIDSSTINLMLQFCDKEELDQTVGSKKIDDFVRSERREETVIVEQSDSAKNDTKAQCDYEHIMKSMEQKSKRSRLAVVMCAVLSFVTLFYELLPMLGVKLSGVFDYSDYPAVYVLFGLQLLVLCVAVRYKECWKGLQCAFSASPSRDSLGALVAIFTAIYDITVMLILAFSGDGLPNLYNAVAVLLLLVCAVMNDLELGAKIKVFEVYSSESEKFTFVKQGADGSIAGKMYAGGLEADKGVYVASRAGEARTFVSSLFKLTRSSKFMSLLVIPLLALGMLASVVSIIIGADAYFACDAFIVCIYFLLPIPFVLCDSISYIFAVSRLAARGSAIAGYETAEHYSDMDIAVFNDLHMFKKCKTEDIGIVIYDTKVGYLVLGCLDALYTKIGGPMSGMNMNLPDVFKFSEVSLRRVSRNGIEALVDRKYSLIVGESEFMKRYGLVFPPNEAENGRSTLCVALDGKVTAKLSVKYATETAFEMLVERLAEQGIACAIQTFDPLISSSLVANSRTLGSSPVSVVHKGAGEISERTDNSNESAVMLISCASRLKLAEAAVWLKKLNKCKKMCRYIGIGLSVLGAAATVLLLIFGGITYINQAVIVAFMLLQFAGMFVLHMLVLPSKKYFTVEGIYSEQEKKYLKQLAREQKRLKTGKKLTDNE